MVLSHYFSILNKECIANFQVSRRISVPEKITHMEEKELWKIHDEKMATFRKKRKELEKEEIKKLNLIDLKIELAKRILSNCCFCERRCGINRKNGEIGFCEVGKQSFYTSEFLHLGEEPELVPSHTIFFSGCTFRCCYCQNWDIAISSKAGRGVDFKYIAQLIALGQIQGSKNVNFVGGNPDPHLLTILKIIKELRANIALIWNSNMYASLETMKILEGIVDLYLGDFRYGNDGCAK
ncbi:MAG: 4Fe-4S cluster-binding domain-containing protein, partial [Actinomycetia bacterium]|nr:4Fe-4S cluster-binding domain-containing protein [Actinomycetes bacterium]